LKNPFLKNLNEKRFNRSRRAAPRGEHRNSAKPCPSWAEPYTICYGNAWHCDD
jgi:hypothetical protein